MQAGIYTMPADQYHADPAPAPSLSASLIKTMLGKSPAHAWLQHPRLNFNHQETNESKFDIGTAAHGLVLEGIDRIVSIEAEDWRTKAARELRDIAREAGGIPVLHKHYDALKNMVGVAHAAMANCSDLSGMTLADGKPEQTMLWQEGGAWCRARPDWISNDHSLIIDYKTTSGSARPEAWARAGLAEQDGDIQAAFYLRGLENLVGQHNTKFVFMVQEIEAPYAVSFIGVSPAYAALGNDKVETGLELWNQCIAKNSWPAYPSRICWAEPAAWTLSQWLEREPTASANNPEYGEIG